MRVCAPSGVNDLYITLHGFICLLILVIMIHNFIICLLILYFLSFIYFSCISEALLVTA